ncbi:MAG: nickel pincer cofactor biosynthesis protein LarC [Candidatus Sumerlaeaceae bacterium]|nr:nickel pincer cofactor biosynthesis protein LarC [Candidatus Sumerlaeaceae bacterium]
MTSAYFDCYNGIGGDMVLGALLDLGLPLEDLRAALGALGVEGWSIAAEPVQRCGIGATLAKVSTTEHHHHRGFGTIQKIIEASGFAEGVKARAIEAFHKIAVAEAAVHQIPIEKVHFHEVGALDAIVDIVGAMWGLDALGIDGVFASPVAVGYGTVKAAHGEMPIPAPATARILETVPVFTGPLAGESTTPTGAAILTTIASSFGPLRDFKISKTGYGAGSRETKGHTNYLRVFLGESSFAGGGLILQSLALIETDIDDMSGELFGHVLDKLFAAGCLDAHLVPIQMKKNRPGVSLRVLADTAKVQELVGLVLRETTTFGVRVLPCDRYSLHRKKETLSTVYGDVSVKVGLDGGRIMQVSPEFEDCRRVAAEKGVALKDVFAAVHAAIEQYRKESERNDG